MVYAVLFFFCFGSTSKVLRGLGEDHPVRLASSLRSKTQDMKENPADETNCEDDRTIVDYNTGKNVAESLNNGFVKKCNAVPNVECGEGEVCGCLYKKKEYKFSPTQIGNGADDLREEKVKNRMDCRQKCEDQHTGGFVCRWWVYNPTRKECSLKNMVPHYFQDIQGERWAGPPCVGD